MDGDELRSGNVWEWKERGAQRIQERFLKWILGLEGRTPGYLVREEMRREKLRERAGRFEERLLRGEGSELARLCLEELRDNVWRDRVGSRWEKERVQFLEERGMMRAQEWEEKR